MNTIKSPKLIVFKNTGKKHIEYLSKHIKTVCTFIKTHIKQFRYFYQTHFNFKQSLVFLLSCIIFMVIILCFCLFSFFNHSTIKQRAQFKKESSIQFALSPKTPISNTTKQSNDTNIQHLPHTQYNFNDTATANSTQLLKLNQLTQQALKNMSAQLSQIQQNLSNKASQSDLQQIQTEVSKPNETLVNQLDHLQNSVKTVIKQTTKKQFIDPKLVEQYFRLVAIQGFSDGMKAIIDVNGNQTVLDINEICPACRGWRVISIDFTNQSAIFENNQHQFVKLQAAY